MQRFPLFVELRFRFAARRNFFAPPLGHPRTTLLAFGKWRFLPVATRALSATFQGHFECF
ncbi:MAG: hypothetical protein DME24_09950 [Verrucomicrobia bacterium]|nr:MAG: hypothetical protein DME24_09950 [Verrucomicrobiota bacterium]